MATLTFCCGAECSVDFAHWQLSGSAAFNTATKRSHTRSIRLNPAASTNFNAMSVVTFSVATGSSHVSRFYMYVASHPTTDAVIAAPWVNTSQGAGLAYKSSDGKYYAAGWSFSGVPGSFGASGITLNTGQWYRVDIKVANSNPNLIVDIQVDGTALGQATYNAGSVTMDRYIFGNVGGQNETLDIYFDDIAWSVTAADYPIGAGQVDTFIAVSDGTHNIAGTGDFQRGNTGTDILNATTTAYQLVDDTPLPASVNEADCIRMVAPAAATNYVECVFGPASGVSTPTVGPRVVSVVAVYHSVSGTANNIRCALNDNGTLTDIVNTSATGATLQYGRLNLNDPPSAASAWHAANDGSDGDFRDLRFRVYSSDANPDTMLDAVMIEAEFAEPASNFAAIGGMQLAMMGCGQM